MPKEVFIGCQNMQSQQFDDNSKYTYVYFKTVWVSTDSILTL